MNNKGFTLLELLIVIAILAVLAAATVFALNPSEMLKKARDSQRISDLSSLKSALVLFQAEVTGADIGLTDCPAPVAGVTPDCVSTASIGDPGELGTNGWIPGLDFSGMAPTPLSNLPVDPTNSATYYYGYAVDADDNFELTATLESAYYGTGGTVDVAAKDGGDETDVYEVGTKLTIISPAA